jgi:hypothetical protein
MATCLAETILATAATSGFTKLSEQEKLYVMLQSVYDASGSPDDLDTLMEAAATAGFSKIDSLRYKACILLQLLAAKDGGTSQASLILADAATSQFMFLAENDKKTAFLQLMCEINDLDPDVSNFVTRSGITDETEIAETNTFVIGLKAASLWDKIFVWYPHVGTTELSHSQNLKSSSFPLVTPFPVASPGPVWNAQGVKIETGYSTTGDRFESTFTVADILSNVGTEFCYGCYFTDEAVKTGVALGLIGMQDTGTPNYYKFDALGAASARSLHGVVGNSANANITFDGWMVSDKAAARLDVYRNGVSVANDTGITVGVASTAFTFGWPGVRDNGATNSTLPTLMYDVRISCFMISETLTPAEHVTLNGLVAAYQSGLGRA